MYICGEGKEEKRGSKSTFTFTVSTLRKDNGPSFSAKMTFIDPRERARGARRKK